MIKVNDRSMCCGCTACHAVCPHDAVTMKADDLGFKYPQVDMSRCTDCGLCESVCDFVSALSVRKSCNGPSGDHEVLAVSHKDAEVLRKSQSGGVFTALSDVVLAEGGVIYGAAFDKDFNVLHTRAETQEERDSFRGSKYVQSDMGEVFRMVRADLKSGRMVLFTGTPCQTAGLSSFIPVSLRGNLILTDFVCHGVPAPYVWRDYLAFRQKKGRIVSADFRDKEAGWKVHKESFVYADGTKKFFETYKVLFYKNVMLRHSCGVCPYDISHRSSDLTIADFWGVGEVLPDFDDNGGVSMVITHTHAGRMLLEKSGADLHVSKTVLSEEFMGARNPNLLKHSRIYHERQEFEEKYPVKGFAYAARRWGDLGWRYKVWETKVLLRKLFGIR